MKPCYHNLGPATCPAWPWCSCDHACNCNIGNPDLKAHGGDPARCPKHGDKPLPDPEQLAFDGMEDE